MDDCSHFLENLLQNRDYPIYKTRMFEKVDDFVQFKIKTFDSGEDKIGATSRN